MLPHQQATSYLSEGRRAPYVALDVETGQVYVTGTGQTAISPPISTTTERQSWMKRVQLSIQKFYKKLGLSHLACIALLIFYTLLGGLLFYAIEYNYDVQLIQRKYILYTREKETTLKNLYTIARNCTTKYQVGLSKWPVEESTCFRAISDTVDDYERQVQLNIPNSSKWDFWYSVYFACTIYTTIGYGDIYCNSVPGRLMTMFYALIGIPILLTTLNDLGKSMFKLLLLLVYHINKVKKYFGLTNNTRKKSSTVNKPVKTKISLSAPIAAAQINFEPDPDSFDVNPSYLSVEQQGEIRSLSKTSSIDQNQVESSNEDFTSDRNDKDENRTELPVWVALCVTVSWIFICAALFCIWETRWEYFESIYFFFISLTTIGLGDVTPDHPKYMIIAYGLVIIGLALVSMSINVIQQKIERLYYQLLEKLLSDYQANLSTGQNQLHATMGMMRMWSSNSKAKYLVPLLSKNAKQTVAHKFQVEKKAQGIDVPDSLKQLNPANGLPMALALAAEKSDDLPQKDLEAIIMEKLRQAEAARKARQCSPTVTLESPSESPQKRSQAAFYDGVTQTDDIFMEDKLEQTVSVPTSDLSIQTDRSDISAQNVIDEAQQTVLIEIDQKDTQTLTIEWRDDEMQTAASSVKDTSNQTLKVIAQDQELQTHLFTTDDQECQVEMVITKVQGVQTTGLPETADEDQQTDAEDMEHDNLLPMTPKKSHGGFAATAKRKLRRVLGGKHGSGRKNTMTKVASHGGITSMESADNLSYHLPSSSTQPELADLVDIEGALNRKDSHRDSIVSIGRLSQMTDLEEEIKKTEAEREISPDLQWNPVDGMHAERQRNVSVLKDLFEHRRMSKK